ncbi:DEAD/DEAH box helicase [Luteolibacter sp. SL250]|uniref:DEAD/DEAH box helicase n=1 Tax=Luteolibacter sp. SL250 TaxID=2995170 RepID=UPI00226F12D9|nr:DEAD/DEAH box helicase [Luteolibacter sp. SL250]WAC19269.1 DEAD/DEAH box helicase [Luteolibacter sp. SL250]
MAFGEFGLDAEILRGIRKAGYTRPTPIQAAAIPHVMRGDDLTAIAQTGTGKTAAFLLPMLNRYRLLHVDGQLRGTKALILAPTRELALQIHANIRTFSEHLPIRAAAIYGGVEEEVQLRALRRGVHIVIATPGRLMHLAKELHLHFSELETLVLDEADRMLDMGFLKDIETIVSNLPPRRQTLMFSATFPREIEGLSRRFQHHPKMVRIGDQSNPADTVRQSIYEVPNHLKGPMLLELLEQPGFTRVLVFTRMKDGANRVFDLLQKGSVQVAKLHSSRSQEQRIKALQDFKDGKVRVLVATDIVGRGIDIEGVTHVVNHDFPVNPEDYIHRIGRTGRAEMTGEAISFVPPGDLNLLHILEMAIGMKLPRKRLKNFNYNARSQPPAAGEKPAKRDWRKRTRDMEAKKAAAAKPGQSGPGKFRKEAKPGPPKAKPDFSKTTSPRKPHVDPAAPERKPGDEPFAKFRRKKS